MYLPKNTKQVGKIKLTTINLQGNYGLLQAHGLNYSLQ